MANWVLLLQDFPAGFILQSVARGFIGPAGLSPDSPSEGGMLVEAIRDGADCKINYAVEIQADCDFGSRPRYHSTVRPRPSSKSTIGL